jgi:hypothetical protein
MRSRVIASKSRRVCTAHHCYFIIRHSLFDAEGSPMANSIFPLSSVLLQLGGSLKRSLGMAPLPNSFGRCLSRLAVAGTATTYAHNPQPATRNPQLATRNSQPATRNSQPATRNPQPATRNPQLATRNPQLAARLILTANLPGKNRAIHQQRLSNQAS